MIKPTVGRVVWFTPANTSPDDSVADAGDQPFAAMITYVHSDRLVNLTTYDHNGVQSPRTSVTLVQEGDPKPDGFYCEWMPFQIGQAKKHEEPADPGLTQNT